MSGHPTWTGARAVGRLAIVGHVPGSQIVNVQHYTLEAGTDPTTADTAILALAADWNTNVRSSFLATLPTDYRLDSLRVTVVAVPGLAHPLFASHDTAPTTTAGTAGTVAGSYSDAVVLKFGTALGGKHHRGRNYYGPFKQGTVVNDGVVADAGTITSINAYMTALRRYILTGAAVADYKLIVFHRPYHAGERQWTVRVGGTLTVRSNPAAEVGEATPIITITSDLVVRQQRKREVGVGA